MTKSYTFNLMKENIFFNFKVTSLAVADNLKSKNNHYINIILKTEKNLNYFKNKSNACK